MQKITLLAWMLGLLAPVLPGAEGGATPAVVVFLDEANAAASYGEYRSPDGETAPRRFVVGFGREGLLPEGDRFRGGYSLLGTFRINAILSRERFEMDERLVEKSGKTAEELRRVLFANMSAIDFDGDGKGGEYGDAFISLEPLATTEQPFGFHPYRGVFRWYSYALHGTQDEVRVGKRITGGCINVGRENLAFLVERLELGQIVEVRRAASR